MEDIIERLERALAAAQTPYLDTRQAAALTGIAAHTLECWRRDGEGPPYVKLGRLVKYRRVDLDTFMASQLIAGAKSRQL